MSNELQVLKILLADEQTKLPIFKKQLANKLKIDYLDFKSIDNMPMTIELGENLRDQLREIFKILKKEEINIY